MSHAISQRLPGQLKELEMSVRAALAKRFTPATGTIEIEPVFCPDVYGPKPLANAIAIRWPVATEHRALVLYPVYPGSQTAIAVGVHGLDNVVADRDDTGGETCDKSIESLESIDLFHSRFRPLPASWPLALYQANHRIVVQLDNSPDDAEITAILTTLESLRSRFAAGLNPDNSCVLLTCLAAELVASTERACHALQSIAGWQATPILIDQLSDYHALLGNATLVLGATEPLCADALLAGVPCLAWGTDATGKQLHTLADIEFANAALHGQSRIESTAELTAVLHQWLAATATSDTSLSATATSSVSTRTDLTIVQVHGTILTPAVDAERRPELSTRLGRSFDQGQRKFRKFRESPGRFVNDSASPLLRPFQNKRQLP